ncbi:hypothetical protein HDU96_011049 [Phlyctochytrium bullatum]|nr:hypothetical protein HDU96_011049 [Phlyctochytrium bullatum]
MSAASTEALPPTSLSTSSRSTTSITTSTLSEILQPSTTTTTTTTTNAPTIIPTEPAVNSNQQIIIGAAVGGGVIFLVVVLLAVILIRRGILANKNRQDVARAGRPSFDGGGSKRTSSSSQLQMPAPEGPSPFGYGSPEADASALSSLAQRDAPTAAAVAAGLIPLSAAMADNRSGSPMLDGYRPPSMLRSRSQSVTGVTSGPAAAAASSLFSRRPSLPATGSSDPVQNIELISAYKDSDLAEKAFQMQRAMSLQRGGYGTGSVLGTGSSFVGSDMVVAAAGYPDMMQRRPSVSSVMTTGSMAKAFAEVEEEARGNGGGPDLETFSVGLESVRWVFARRASYGGPTGHSAAPEAVYPNLVGGSANIPGGGWGVALERRGIYHPVGQPLVPAPQSVTASPAMASSNLHISTPTPGGYVAAAGPTGGVAPTATATLDPSTGRVVLMDTPLDTGPTTTVTEMPLSPMMDMLNDTRTAPSPAPSATQQPPGSQHSAAGSSFGSLPRRPSNHSTLPTRPSLPRPGTSASNPTRSIREQVQLWLVWKEASIALRRRQVAADLDPVVAPPPPLPRLRPHPLLVAVATGERQDAWPTFLQQLTTVLLGLADLEDAAQSAAAAAAASPTALPALPRLHMPDRLNEALQELCSTVTTLARTGTPIPVRIGYEPRATNEIPLKRHDVVVLLHRFDDDFGYGVNRSTGAVGFVNLSHLDPKRLNVAVEPAPLPLPVPPLPAHLRSMRSPYAAAPSPMPSVNGSGVGLRRQNSNASSTPSSAYGAAVPQLWNAPVAAMPPPLNDPASTPTSHILASLGGGTPPSSPPQGPPLSAPPLPGPGFPSLSRAASSSNPATPTATTSYTPRIGTGGIRRPSAPSVSAVATASPYQQFTPPPPSSTLFFGAATGQPPVPSPASGGFRQGPRRPSAGSAAGVPAAVAVGRRTAMPSYASSLTSESDAASAARMPVGAEPRAVAEAAAPAPPVETAQAAPAVARQAFDPALVSPASSSSSASSYGFGLPSRSAAAAGHAAAGDEPIPAGTVTASPPAGPGGVRRRSFSNLLQMLDESANLAVATPTTPSTLASSVMTGGGGAAPTTSPVPPVPPIDPAYRVGAEEETGMGRTGRRFVPSATYSDLTAPMNSASTGNSGGTGGTGVVEEVG